MTRRLLLAAVALLVVGLLAALYPAPVERPVKDGSGPNAITVAARYPAPQYHTPVDWWQTHHMEAVNRGDLAQGDCLFCHEPERSCNNCHEYVGVDPIAPMGSMAADGAQ